MPYFLILLVPLLLFLPTAAAIVYHLKKYGLEGDKSNIMTTVFVLVSLALIILAIAAYLKVDWAQFDKYTITIFNNY